MAEIEIDERQRDYLDQLRTQLADEHVGDYGHVRYRDALQYLIDHRESTEGEVGAASTAEGDSDTGPGGTDAESEETDESDDGDADTDGSESGDENAESGDKDAGSGDDDTGGDSGGSASRLQRMMGLLDDHDDVWEQTDGEEGRYAVTLPDGSTEQVRTKDDVRALLFQHYD